MLRMEAIAAAIERVVLMTAAASSDGHPAEVQHIVNKYFKFDVHRLNT
jgi:hypothetical protein